MSTLISSSPSSSAFRFPLPSSPSKDDALKPNPHPYPIKTTSTGALSRSHSSPHREAAHHKQNSSGHHYIPPPSPSPSRSRKDSHGDARPHHHRYSRSLTSDLPRPLPVPPTFPTSVSASTSPTRADHEYETPPRRRSRRADTLPPPQTASVNNNNSVDLIDTLPPNPKEWTPAQLSTYLTTALRVKSGEALVNLPTPVARDIAKFVRESKITGKAFLRFKEADLEKYHMNKLWRQTLLSASRTLKQSMLRGQLWGFSTSPTSPLSPSSSPFPGHSSLANSDDVEDDNDTPNNRSLTSTYSAFNVKAEMGPPSPTSSISSASSRGSRVRGMVASFERSSSASPVKRDRRERSGSVSSIDSVEGRDEYGHAYGDNGKHAFVFGRRGLGIAQTQGGMGVETRPLPIVPGWDAIPNNIGTLSQQSTGSSSQRPLPVPPAFAAGWETGSPTPSVAATHTTGGGLEVWETASESSPVQTITAAQRGRHVPRSFADDEEEMTMEELLASVGGGNERVGAAAWEMDVGLGDTVKHVPLPPIVAPQPRTPPADAQSLSDGLLAGIAVDAAEPEQQEHHHLEHEASGMAAEAEADTDLAGEEAWTLPMTGTGRIARGGRNKGPIGTGSKIRLKVKGTGSKATLDAGMSRGKGKAKEGGTSARRGLGDIFGFGDANESTSVPEETATADGMIAATLQAEPLYVDRHRLQQQQEEEGDISLGTDLRRRLEVEQAKATEKERRQEQEEHEERELERLKMEIEETMKLVEEVRGRVGEVERRVWSLEERENKRDAEKDRDEIQKFVEASTHEVEATSSKTSQEEETEKAEAKKDIWGYLLDPKFALKRVLEMSMALPASVGFGASSVVGDDGGSEASSRSPSPWPNLYEATATVDPTASTSITTPSDVNEHESNERRATAKQRKHTRVKRLMEPSSLTAIPPYVLLVSIGVCAVVLRVVLKRALRGGRR